DRAASRRPPAARSPSRGVATGPSRSDVAAFRRPHRPRRNDVLGPIRSLRPGAPVRRGIGAVARLRSTTATSAGGIVIRQQSGVLEFVAGRRRRDHAHTWTLPKGTPIPGETTEQTALREVGEETGLEVRIVAPFDSINYTFIQ